MPKLLLTKAKYVSYFCDNGDARPALGCPNKMKFLKSSWGPPKKFLCGTK